MKKLQPKQIIQELAALRQCTEIESITIDDWAKKTFQYAPIPHYLRLLRMQVKPESASTDLFKDLSQDIFGQRTVPELRLTGGFIDFYIQEEDGNPVLLELKPAFRFDTTKDRYTAIKLVPDTYKEQIQKYLIHSDFVLLTNLDTAFLFNRSAFVYYRPFLEIPFDELLLQYLNNGNLWDTIRRLEDTYVRPELDEDFFRDLTLWFEWLSVVRWHETEQFGKNELIVLLINKVIFIKTLEDFGLIPYRFLIEKYNQKHDEWQVKGIRKILEKFFTEIEDWFWEYYDTELFQVKIWDFIDKDKRNLETFARIFEKVLGVSDWERSSGTKGMLHYNYRKIDEDVFGKAYETFIAQSRKDSGIYYTHRSIVQYMTEQTIERLFAAPVQHICHLLDNQDFEQAATAFRQMAVLAVADTTSGSGSFVIKLFRAVYKQYLIIAQKFDWLDNFGGNGLFDVPPFVAKAMDFRQQFLLAPKQRRQLISYIILNHIYALDIDERALDTAKTNLWKEAVKMERGLFNFRNLGDNNHILPSLWLNFVNADAIYDLPIEQQLQLLAPHAHTIAQLYQLRQEYLQNPYFPQVLDQAVNLRQQLRNTLEAHFPQRLRRPTLVCLEFFFLFFDANGQPLPQHQQGFAAIVSNPPWEAIYPVQKEFAQVGKYGTDKNEFNAEFEARLAADANFKAAWEKYKRFYEQYKEYIFKLYPYQSLKPEQGGGMGVYPNLFKLLFERDTALVQQGGYLNLLIPSSFQTDEGCYGLRRLAFVENTLLEIISFENRGFSELTDKGEWRKTKFFAEVDNRFKFSIVHFQKTPPPTQHQFQARFYLTHPEQMQEQPLCYDLPLIQRFSPSHLALMEFGSSQDYALCAKIKAEHAFLRDFGYQFKREFHVTDDAKLLQKVPAPNRLPVYEGKIIHQYHAQYAPFNSYIDQTTAHADLLGKELKRIKTDLQLKEKTDHLAQLFAQNNCLLPYQTYRLAYRAVASSTNERTLIATLIPPNHFAVHSINYLINNSYQNSQNTVFQQITLPHEDVLYLAAMLNSLVLNYYIRNKVSANLTMFYLYELPLPQVTPEQKREIAEMVLALLQPQPYYSDLATQLGITQTPNPDYIGIRSRLEAYIAHRLYGLTLNDWVYLTGTFIYGEGDTRAELDAIIKHSQNPDFW